jgi:hypothetical protein
VSILLKAKAQHPVLQRFPTEDAAECARLCYSTSSCRSAVFTPKNFEVLERRKKRGEINFSEQSGEEILEFGKTSGMCTLLPLAGDCDQDGGLISRVRHESLPIFLYCFSCRPSFIQDRMEATSFDGVGDAINDDESGEKNRQKTRTKRARYIFGSVPYLFSILHRQIEVTVVVRTV